MTDVSEPPLPTESGSNGPKRVALPGISPRAWEHPADRAALTAMRKVPGFDLLVRKFIGLVSERRFRYLFLGSAVRVNERQFPEVDRVYRESLEILDVPSRPELFIAQTPIVNAGAVGADEPFIVLNSGALDLSSTDELRLILGHELGHILSGHVLFKTMLKLLLQLSVGRLGIPLVGLARAALVAALLEWDRKSELSSDRAALLCNQDAHAAYRFFMKMAGGKHISQMSLDEFIAQAEEYEAGGDKLDSMIKLMALSGQQHPFWVMRLAELRRWVESGAYETVLGGDYARRESDDDASVVDDLKESAQAYKDSAESTKDPLMQSLRDLGASLAETGSSLFGSLFGGRGKGGQANADEDDDDTRAAKEALDEILGDGPVDERR